MTISHVEKCAILSVWKAVRNAVDLSSGEERGRAELFMELPDRNDYPDYFEFIKNPIDLSMIEQRVRKDKYTSTMAFERDMSQMFMNACTYNMEDSEVFEDAMFMKDLFTRVLNMMKKTGKIKDAGAQELANPEHDEFAGPNGEWRCAWCHCTRAQSRGNRLSGPNGQKELCHSCGYRYRRGNRQPPKMDASGNFICTICNRAFSSVQGLGIHRRRTKECGESQEKKKTGQQWIGNLTGWMPAPSSRKKRGYHFKVPKIQDTGGYNYEKAAGRLKRSPTVPELVVGTQIMYVFAVDAGREQWYPGLIVASPRNHDLARFGWYHVMFDDGEELQVKMQTENRYVAWRLASEEARATPNHKRKGADDGTERKSKKKKQASKPKPAPPPSDATAIVQYDPSVSLAERASAGTELENRTVAATRRPKVRAVWTPPIPTNSSLGRSSRQSKDCQPPKSKYELEREETIRQNLSVLRQLGLSGTMGDHVPRRKASPGGSTKPKQPSPGPSRRSGRNVGKPAVRYDAVEGIDEEEDFDSGDIKHSV